MMHVFVLDSVAVAVQKYSAMTGRAHVSYMLEHRLEHDAKLQLTGCLQQDSQDVERCNLCFSCYCHVCLMLNN
jgi:hypothetical protein